MGRKQWTTPDQRAYLQALIPAFIEAQKARLTKPFFEEDTYPDWHKKWPTPTPTQDEIDGAGGNAQKALVTMQEATEEVRPSLNRVRGDTNFTFVHQRVKCWFHNHTRGSSSGNGTRGVLKLGPAPKLVQPWQAYLRMFQHTKLKDKIEEAWEAYQNEVPEDQERRKTKFEIRNKVAQKLYAIETPAVKKEVEKQRQEMMSNKKTDDLDGRNKEFQT
jgi:hypothetical protein